MDVTPALEAFQKQNAIKHPLLSDQRRQMLPAYGAMITDEKSPIYRNRDAARAAGFDDIPVPPTYFFSAAGFWGAFPEAQPSDAAPERNPTMEIIGQLMAKGGMVLHGEQEFTYHKPVTAGQMVRSEGEVVDLYEKASGERTMTFRVRFPTCGRKRSVPAPVAPSRPPK